MATHSTVWTGILSTASSSLSVGYGVVKNGDVYLPATSANRTSYGRTVGIAITAASSTARAFEFQVAGVVPNSITGLGTGTTSWVRISSTGTLERCTPSSGDDLVGKCLTTGDLILSPGVWDSTNYTASAGTTPTGTGFRHVTSGTEDAASAKVDLTASADVTVPAAGVVTSDGTVLASTSTLVHERGGLEADVSAYSGLVKISGGATSAVALGTGVETFLGTPSGANLASALTSGLPTSKGGTGLTTAVVRFATSAISGTSNHDVDLGIVSGEVCIVYLTDTGAVTVTGIVPPTGGGSAVLILRKGTAQLTLTNESASSTAANRLTIGGTAASYGWVLVYNTSTARWEMAAYPAYEA